MKGAIQQLSLQEKVQAVTEEMSHCASQSDWARAAELGALRLNLLEALFAGAAPGISNADEVALIESILEADRTLAQLAGAGRSEVLVQLEAHRRGRDATQTYRDASLDC